MTLGILAKAGGQPHRTAFAFVLLIGILSFFADFAYEGSRSIIGPYLATLGASAAIVGVVTGFGEFLGYGLRLVSGVLPIEPANSGRSPFSAMSSRCWPCRRLR